MSVINLLFEREIPVNSKISVKIPTVGEVIDNESKYYSSVSLITSMPIDMIAALDEAGIDFTSINEYELFLLMFNTLREYDTSLIFGDLDISNFEMAENAENNEIVLLDRKNDIVIDRAIHGKISSILRKVNHMEKNIRKPGNEEAKRYMIKRAKEKARRKKKRSDFSQLESLIISMVNSEPYKYNFEETRNLTIYQFNESVRQVIKKTEYNNRMFGVYSGTINVKELSQDEINWLIHK